MQFSQVPQRVLYQTGKPYHPLIHKKENIFSPNKPCSSSFQIDQSKIEMEKDLKIMIDHNQRMKQQINQQALDYENLRNQFDRTTQDNLRLVNELEQLQKLQDLNLRDQRIKQEQIKELQVFIETNSMSLNKQSEEMANYKSIIQHKDQELLRIKQMFEEKTLENQEIRNTLTTINGKVQFMTQQKDQQYQIIEKFNQELQEEISQKTQQIHNLSQTLSNNQQQLQQVSLDLESCKQKVITQEQQLPLQQLQGKYLILITENERLHTVLMQEQRKTKQQSVQLQHSQMENEQLKYEIKKLVEEITKLQQGLAYEQKNYYLIDDLRKQLTLYAEENARLNLMIYGK